MVEKLTKGNFSKIPFRMHPRVFAALGADLVTNDVVAVIELVKNSYDAFASNVWVQFKNHPTKGEYIEIRDDGLGMTSAIIEDVWCLVATPHKQYNPISNIGKNKRRVAGEKGLGRLSVARLGEHIRMLTQAPKSDCWEVKVDWTEVASGSDLTGSYAHFRKYPKDSPFEKSGTLIEVYGLKENWDEAKITDLEDNLARLISPFEKTGKFNISLISVQEDISTDGIRIESPEFLSKPKYSISGEVDKKGNINAAYNFKPIKEGSKRTVKLKYTWEQVYDVIQDRSRLPFKKISTHCGSFSFEIRGWDIAAEDTQEIADQFDFQKSQIRKSIRAHKGISVYRDDILVLPKSENARDWLGLDLRRVSKVGARMSTSQLVGYVNISVQENPLLKDTSDRERLVSNLAVAEFGELLMAIISLMENERDADRVSPQKEKPLGDLMGQLDADDLVSDIADLANEGATAADVVPILKDYNVRLKVIRKTIESNLIYYSRLATVGTIAQMLVHEIRNRTIAFGSFLDFIKDRFGPFKDKNLKEEYMYAEEAANSLETLADTFSPLASRGFRRRHKDSLLEDRIQSCLNFQRGELKNKHIKCVIPKGSTPVAVDPGELDAILLNLLTNSIYWLGQKKDKKRQINFQFSKIDKGSRVRIWIHDNGPGLTNEDGEKVFWPGFTKKPGGIGMGLTIASELVNEYGGKMAIATPGKLGGASFVFDLPIRK